MDSDFLRGHNIGSVRDGAGNSLPGKNFMTEAEGSFSNHSNHNKGQGSDVETIPESQYEELQKSHIGMDENTPDNHLIVEEDSVRHNMPSKTEGLYPHLDDSLQGHVIGSSVDVCDMSHGSPSSSELNTEKGYFDVRKEDGTDEYDNLLSAGNDERKSAPGSQISNTSVCKTILPRNTDADYSPKEDTVPRKYEGNYFYYEAPFYEETGSWIPVSVPPMSGKEYEEWTSGFSSNGGFIPEGDIGWGQCIGEGKELTMWDVVLEMLLVARGKVTAITSGDITQMSWISAHLVEQAWKEMAQTLTEANFGKSQEILESAPPKWLPDSSASSCMLCGVRFHPILCARHHCRFCGGIFCGECTKGRSLLPEKFRTGDPQRVCDVCGVRLESVQPYLMDQVSRAAQLPTHDLTDLSTLRSWVNFPWGQSMEYEIYKATNTVRSYTTIGSLKPEKRIPGAILQNAKGLAILTVVKVGVMVTYNVGTGLVVARRDDSSWSPPSAISSFGLGWGAQAGGELTDFIVVLRTNEAVKTFCSNAHLSMGAGLSAAIGIFGRTAQADVRAGGSGYGACYTYSCSKGAFIGCSLEGSMVTTRAKVNSRFYGNHSINASDILLGSLPRPPAAATLYHALRDLYMQLDK